MGGRTERRAGRGNGNGDGQSANVAPTMSGPSNPHRFCSCLAQAMPAGPSSRVHGVGKGGVYVRRRSTFIGDAAGAKFLSAMPPIRTKRRSEEHKSELQSLMSISYAVLCLKKKNTDMIPRTTSHIDMINTIHLPELVFM